MKMGFKIQEFSEDLGFSLIFMFDPKSRGDSQGEKF